MPRWKGWQTAGWFGQTGFGPGDRHRLKGRNPHQRNRLSQRHPWYAQGHPALRWPSRVYARPSRLPARRPG